MSVFTSKTDTEQVMNRLEQLSTEVRELKTAQKHLELEWEDLYDKVRKQMARMSRRAKADAKLNGEDPDETSPDSPTDSLDPISRSIMLRRGMVVRPK